MKKFCFLFLLYSCGGVSAPQTCETQDDCFENYTCAVPDEGGDKECLRACTGDSMCLNSQRCDTVNSVCRILK